MERNAKQSRRGHHHGAEPSDAALAGAIDALPPDAFDNLTSFLLGIDLFHLSHTNQQLQELIDGDQTIWRQRVISSFANDPNQGDAAARETTIALTATSYKEQCIRGKSMRFRGTGKTHQERWSCAKLQTRLPLNERRPIAFDVWFSLLPGNAATHEGGILLGAQSCAFEHTDWWADNHQQFVLVDANRTLFCSVMAHKPAIATNLDIGKWYHLALVFYQDHQRVYLDGQLVQEQRGGVHHEAYHLRHMQVGTGCITAGMTSNPTPGFCSWYGFNGLVDGFRSWATALSDGDVQKLTRGESLPYEPVESLHHGNERTEVMGGASYVRCSRPQERVCILYECL